MYFLFKHKEVKALIIDDEIDTCYLLRSILKNKSIHADYVNTLTDAINIIENNNHEIIFLDNHLQDGIGIDFIHRIKKFRPDAKVVMITAHDSADDREKALKNGADFFIGKPFTSDIIFKAVDEVS